MSERVLVTTEETFLEGLVRAPGRMDLVDSLTTGAVNGLIGTALLAGEAEDTTSKVVELAVSKPIGATLAVFSALCLKSAATQVYRAIRN